MRIPTTTGGTRYRPLLLGHVHDGCDRSTDPFCGSLDSPIVEMGVAQRHADVGVTEHPRDDWHRNAVHHRVARMGMTEVVKADILDTGLAANPVPQREIVAVRPTRIARRRGRRPSLGLRASPGSGRCGAADVTVRV